MKKAIIVSLLLVSSAGYSSATEDPKVSDGLTTNEVQSVVKTNLNKVRHCYEQVLAKTPKAKGKLTVDFTIAGTGKVGGSKVSNDTVGDKGLDECVLKTVNTWTFPKPKDGKTVEVSYPFQFDPL